MDKKIENRGLCPMRTGVATLAEHDCIGRYCAWFDDETGRCAVLLLARSTQTIAEIQNSGGM